MEEVVFAWARAFAFTQLVEVPIYLWAQRKSARPISQRIAIGFGASMLTHPMVWFVIPPLVYLLLPPWTNPAGYPVMVAVAETFAVVVEAYYLSVLGVPRAWVWSLAANGASCGLGFVTRWAFDWP